MIHFLINSFNYFELIWISYSATYAHLRTAYDRCRCYRKFHQLGLCFSISTVSVYYSSRPTWHHTLAEELYSSTFVSTNQRPSLPVSTNQSSGISYELRVTSQIGYWNKNGLTSKWLLAQVATFLIFDNRQWISVIEWHKLKWTIVRNQGCLGVDPLNICECMYRFVFIKIWNDF